MKGHLPALWWKVSQKNHSVIGLLCFLVLSLTTLAKSHALPTTSATPGGIVAIPLDIDVNAIPNVTFQNRPVSVVKQNNQWVAVVGLPLSLKAGYQEIRVNGQGQGFQVKTKDYPEQHIQLKTRKHIDLSAEDLARHRGEKAKAKKVFQHFDSQQEPDFAFLKPVEGPYSSPFGLKRFFNGEPRNPHSGLDIAAKTGTPIKSPSHGKVVLTGNFFFNGNVVYVDHGQGVISMFCHLDSIGVKKGDTLHKGQVLGKVGATGRVTGPHLHWSVSLNNARIDPMLLLDKSEWPTEK